MQDSENALGMAVSKLGQYLKNKREMSSHSRSVEKKYRKKQDLDGFKKITELIPELASYKAEQYEHLLAQAQKAGCADLNEYYEHLLAHGEELEKLRSNLTYLGSHFFRGSDWDFFNETCLKTFEGRDKVRVWCAGCATGQEAYSTILCLLDHVPLEAIEVLATDYNEGQIEKTRSGSYFNMHLHEVPERYRKYLTEGEKKFEFLPEIRAKITVGLLNLLTDPYPEGFDVIICRNVIKFFNSDAILMVQEKLASSLNKDGFVFLSRDDNAKTAEMIMNPSRLGLKQMADKSIYRKIV